MQKLSVLLILALLIGLPAFAQDAGSVSGTVSTEDGDPVAGAQIVMMGQFGGNGMPEIHRANSDDEGNFTFDEVGVGNYNISAMAMQLGMAQAEIQVAAGEETFVELVLGQRGGGDGGGGGDDEDREFGSVSGTVSTEDGEAVEGAQIILMGAMDGNRRPDVYRTETNDEGEFSVEEVAVGDYHITATVMMEGMAQDDIEVAVDENTVVDLVLGQGNGGGGGGGEDDRAAGSVSGTVSTEDGALVADAQVVLMGEMNGNNRPDMYRGQTNEDGEFVFERVVVGNYQITATLGREGMAQDDIEVAADENTEVDLVLGQGDGGGGGGDDDRAAGSVSGTVSTEDGESVEGAQVLLMSAMDDNRRPDIYRAETNAEGEFNFERVAVGNYQITATAMILGIAQDDIEVAADENTVVEMVIMGRNGDDEPDEVGGVAGTVADADGTPIDRAEIRLMDGMDNQNRHPYQARTLSNEEGQYSFENVPAGVLMLSAGKIGFMPFMDEIEVTADEVLEYDFVLDGFHHDDWDLGSVSGTVINEEHNPLEGANVILIPQHGDDDRGNPGGGWDRPLFAFTDEEGNFLIDEVPVGNYIARATKMGFGMDDHHIEVVVDENTEVNFVLEHHQDDDDHGGGDDHGDHGDHGGHGDHDGEEVELHGWVIVIDGDRADIYLLDTDEDGEADFLLNFGPPDYQPDNGAERPANGDEVTIGGLRVGHMEPAMVIVLTINDQVWLDIEHDGHGGRPGGGDGWGDNPGGPDMVEAEGHSVVRDDAAWFERYSMNIDDDMHSDYCLFFGNENYSPDNGAVRPENGDFASIIGGEFITDDGLPIIVVYEINGQLWREPGDTLGLYWDNPNAVDENEINIPISAILIETFPNPFNSTTTIDYFIPEAGRVNLSVFNAAGRHIETLSDGWQSAGEHQSAFTAWSHPAGVYILRMEAGNAVQTRRLLLLK